ncbi:hypothetical protein WJX81_003835, partial [Elliptochloris bilobata]
MEKGIGKTLEADAGSQVAAQADAGVRGGRPRALCATRRDRLPEPAQRPSLTFANLFALVKDFVGTDVSLQKDMSLPTNFCEPLTDLQRRGEFMSYSELLDQAADAEAGSLQRLLLVTAYAVSVYSCVDRTWAPFRSPTGETCELVDEERGIRALGEKCAECPGQQAFVCEGRRWVFSADEQNKIEFRGNYANWRPTALLSVKFWDSEELEWQPLLTTVSHILIGKLSIHHTGTLHVHGSTSGLASKTVFREPLLALSSRHVHAVKGHIERDGQPLHYPRIHGRWDSAVYVSHKQGQDELLFQPRAPPLHPCRYGFGTWTLGLNDMPASLERILPPSDARRRRDLRLLEEGRYVEADAERLRILKRIAAARALATQSHQPRWFKLNPEATLGQARRLEYAGGYWEARAAVEAGQAA